MYDYSIKNNDSCATCLRLVPLTCSAQMTILPRSFSPSYTRRRILGFCNVVCLPSTSLTWYWENQKTQNPPFLRLGFFFHTKRCEEDHPRCVHPISWDFKKFEVRSTPTLATPLKVFPFSFSATLNDIKFNAT